MEVVTTRIDGPLIIKPSVFADQRGHVFEQFNKSTYRELGITADFVQDNCTYSRIGAIRGLHYQVGDYAQGKLATAVYGRVLDVAVDIRFGSPTFGQHVSVELNSNNQLQLWIPEGFAHGVSVLSDEAVLCYKCTAFFSPEHSRRILYDDPELAIDWKVNISIVSAKDVAATPFQSIERDFVFHEQV